jgi:transcriptional regulator with XRE-family HTH domain
MKNNSLAQRIVEHRQRSFQTLEALGAELGVSAQYLHAIERGRAMPKGAMLARFAKFFRVKAEELAEAGPRQSYRRSVDCRS